MHTNATQITERGIAAIQSAENTQALELIKAQYLGKTGELNALLKQLGALSVEEKKTVGAHINECKTRFQAAFALCERVGSSWHRVGMIGRGKA